MSAASPKPPENDALERATASDWSLLRRSWTWARPDAPLFAWALFVTPAIAAINLAQPWLMKRTIDEHIVPGLIPGLASMALAYLGAVVGGYLLEATYAIALAHTLLCAALLSGHGLRDQCHQQVHRLGGFGRRVAHHLAQPPRLY